MRQQILIADNRQKVRYALRILIQEQTDWIITGSAANAAEVLEKIDSDRPEALLLDWDLPGMSMIELLDAIRRISQGIIIIILSTNPELRQEVLGLGANYFISKMDPPDKLRETLLYCQHHLPGLS